MPCKGQKVASERRPRLSIQGIGRLVYLVLTVAVLVSTVAVWILVQQIFNNFGPAVQQDLDWKTVRGAQELARACDLGLAVGDQKIVQDGFGDYRNVRDVVAIVALGAGGKIVAIHGSPPEKLDDMFSGAPVTIRRTPEYLVAWAGATIEGSPVGKIAIAISTRRLIDSATRLRRISYGSTGAGLAVLLFGLIFVRFFTRAIVARDAQLAAYAAGLEQRVAERTAELDGRNRGMRLVLDNVVQGFITVGLDGVMASERSSVVEKWFGRAPDGMKLSEYVRATDRTAADWLDIGLEALAEDTLPRELLIGQLPKRIQSAQRTWSIAYRPIMGRHDDQKLDRLLVVLSDITDELVRERMERDSHEMVGIFQRVTADRGGAEQFFEEARALVEKIAAADTTPETEARLIHTLKGNCALFGVDSMAQVCHDIESQMRSEGRSSNESEREQIGNQWRHITELTGSFLGDHRSTIELETVDLEEMVKAIEGKAPSSELLAIANGWRFEPVGLRFKRLADRAIYLAKGLGRSPVTVHTDANGIRLDARRWAPFWSAMVHAVNNAVDHGIENADARVARGKSPAGTLWLTARRQGAELHISLRDDGQGIDWTRLRQKAAERGVPNATTADLVELMCMDGISTRDNATATSGRGVGLAALKEATLSLGGHMEVESEPGKGTRFLFRFPTQATAVS
jgi:HPt (histidine-containing phosphotransfer) domain-containing protein